MKNKPLPEVWYKRLPFLLALLFAHPSWASVPASIGVDSIYLLKLFLALLFVLGIFLILAKVVRQINGASISSSGPLSIIASLSVGSRDKIVIVAVGEQQVLLGIGPAGIVKLKDLDKPVRVENEPVIHSFKSQLNSMLGDRIN